MNEQTRTVPPERPEATGPMYLIWSNEHQAWWRPNSRGYTLSVEAAGRYERDEALTIASRSRDGWFAGEAPPEIAIREEDVLAHCRQAERPRQRSRGF